MINPAPTTTIDPSIARGVLIEQRSSSAGSPARIVLSFANTNYQVHLTPLGTMGQVEAGKRVLGVIRAQARRVDIVETGGKYVEPVYGHPRRVQGRVLATSPATREIIVDAGMPIHCMLTDVRQSTQDFNAGDFVSFDVLDGATFSPAAR